MSEAKRILHSIESGDPRAADELLPLVYFTGRSATTQSGFDATLAVTNSVGGGLVTMENRLINAPVFDTDASTRLAGSNYICQL